MSTQLVLILIVILVQSISPTTGQFRRRTRPGDSFPGLRSNRPAGNNPSGSSDEPRERIKCLVCDAEFTYPGILSESQSKRTDVYGHPLKNTCFNPSLNATEAEDDFLVTCPKWSDYCTTELQYMNNVVVRIDRRCSERVMFCPQSKSQWLANPIGPFPEHCVTKGFGVGWKFCYTCCPGAGDPMPPPLPGRPGSRSRLNRLIAADESTGLKAKYQNIKNGNQRNCYFRN